MVSRRLFRFVGPVLGFLLRPTTRIAVSTFCFVSEVVIAVQLCSSRSGQHSSSGTSQQLHRHEEHSSTNNGESVWQQLGNRIRSWMSRVPRGRCPRRLRTSCRCRARGPAVLANERTHTRGLSSGRVETHEERATEVQRVEDDRNVFVVAWVLGAIVFVLVCGMAFCVRSVPLQDSVVLAYGCAWIPGLCCFAGRKLYQGERRHSARSSFEQWCTDCQMFPCIYVGPERIFHCVAKCLMCVCVCRR